MHKCGDIIDAINMDDLDMVESLCGLYDHQRSIKLIAQVNCIDIIERKTNGYFFKLFERNDKKNKWEFCFAKCKAAVQLHSGAVHY